jgi:beta-glucanase (GH16 family)
MWSQATWNLIWSEEFNGTQINTQQWNYDIGTGDWGWGNNELQYYTNQSANLSVSNGLATFRALDQPFGNSAYTSARIQSKNKFSVQYGKIEARMKLPMGQGLWPAFWMLGQNLDAVSWPNCGEIDIMEHVNNNPYINGTVHWYQNGHQSSGSSITTDITQFHLYSIEWNENNIQWFVDGILYKTFNIQSSVHSAFHQPFFIIMNVAVGGLWPGSPDNTTIFPAEMVVDYIRVYQPETAGITENEIEENLYPNPNNGSFNISNAQDVKYIRIYNTLGKLVWNASMITGNISTDLTKGWYIAEVVRKNDSVQREILIIE